jgi:hypothetical protein
MYLLQAASVESMHKVLENLYNEMIPLCSRLISVAQMIAGFGALWYIGYRVWKHIANAEPIEFFPLLRPFAIGIAISIFPGVLGVINGVLSPTVTVTQSMVTGTQDDIQRLLHQRELVSNGANPSLFLTDPGTGDSSSSFWSGLFTLNFPQLFKLFISTLLELLYYAASLCIDCMRTFHLVILAILGPLVLALSVYDGFQHTLAIWFGRYINIYLWLPIANLFGALIGKIQASMLQLDITQMQQGQEGYFSQTDAAYIIFLIIGVIGYLTIPSVANHIVHASGGGALMNKVNTIIASRINISRFAGSKMSTINGPGQANNNVGNANSFMRDKITGK